MEEIHRRIFIFGFDLKCVKCEKPLTRGADEANVNLTKITSCKRVLVLIRRDCVHIHVHIHMCMYLNAMCIYIYIHRKDIKQETYKFPRIF